MLADTLSLGFNVLFVFLEGWTLAACAASSCRIVLGLVFHCKAQAAPGSLRLCKGYEGAVQGAAHRHEKRHFF